MLFKKKPRIRKDYLLRKLRGKIKITRYLYLREDEGYNKGIRDAIKIIENSKN